MNHTFQVMKLKQNGENSIQTEKQNKSDLLEQRLDLHELEFPSNRFIFGLIIMKPVENSSVKCSIDPNHCDFSAFHSIFRCK